MRDTMSDKTWQLIMTSDEFGTEVFEPYDSAAAAWAAADRISSTPEAKNYPAQRWFRVEEVEGGEDPEGVEICSL